MQLSIQAKRICRYVARADSNQRIEIIDGSDAPALVGRSYYWTTPSGKTIVHHPSAYGWPTWYHASTRRVTVGRDWLIARGLLEIPTPDCESIRIPADSRELSLSVA